MLFNMKNRRVVIGVDSGDFTATAHLTNPDHTIIADIQTVSVRFPDSGHEALASSIHGIVGELCTAAKTGIEAVDCIVVALSNYVRIEDENRSRQELNKIWKKRKHKPSVHLMNRAYLALRALVTQSPAMAVSCDAQATLCSRDEGGRYTYAGGWGAAIDYGGGSDSLGKRSLGSLALFFDDRLGDSLIGRTARKMLDIDSRGSLLAQLYESKIDPGSFIPIIFEAARERDPVARQLIDATADECVEIIRSAITRFPVREMIPVVLFGSMIDSYEVYRNLVKSKIRATIPQAAVKSIAFSALEASVKIASEYQSSVKRQGRAV